jgi:hypothetical protein
VTVTSGGDVTGCNLTPVGRGMPRAPVPFSAVVGRHTAGVALRSDGVQGSAVRARGKGGKQTNSRRKTFIYTMYKGDHLVKARSSGDGARDLGDVLGGKGDKGVFVLTSVGPETSLPLGGVERERKRERERERIGVQRGCGGVTGFGGGGDWGRPGSLTRGANGPETRDERDDLVRSLGERNRG